MKKNKNDNGNINDNEIKKENEIKTENSNEHLPKISTETEERRPDVSMNQSETLPVPAMDRILDTEPYVGTDSSAVNTVTTIYTEEEKSDPNVAMVNDWIKSLDRGDVNVIREIDLGIDIAKTVSNGFNEFYNLSQMTLAGRLILVGKVCLTLKRLTRTAGFLWSRWADTHLPFLKPRSRERAMLLASREDCFPYLILGIERLELLCQATRDSKAKDPIGDLLKRYNILFSQDSENSPAEFKALVDAVLNNEKLRENQIEVNFELVKQLTYFKVELDNSLLSKLNEVEASGGSKVKYLELLAINGGKILPPPDSEQRLRDFNSLSSRLVKTLAFIREDESHLQKIDKTVFLQLWEELQVLKSKIIFEEEVKNAA